MQKSKLSVTKELIRLVFTVLTLLSEVRTVSGSRWFQLAVVLWDWSLVIPVFL